MKNENLTTQRRVLDGLREVSVLCSETRDRARFSPSTQCGWLRGMKRGVAIFTVVIFTAFTIAPSWALAETINLDGGTVDVSVQDNATNWNVSGNPVWNVPEFNVPAGNIYNIAGLNQNASLALLVNGGQATNIFGTMNLSNLSFILQNIAGINIGSTGLVNLNNASLIASTLPLNLNVTDFLAHDYQFSGQGGFLMNDGKIIGNSADLVALIANAIENRGVIDVPMGTVALATGNMVTVGISGDGFVSIGVDESTANDMGLSDQIRNTGTISAEGGRVVLSAKAMDGLFDRAISLDREGESLSVIKAKNGLVEFVTFDDFYNSGTLSAMNGRILVDSKGNITNEGDINALNGSIEMTSGQSVYNKNLIEALGGKVEITAKEGEVTNAGVIDASKGLVEVTAWQDVTNEATVRADQGEIKIASTQGDITNAGTLKADDGTLGLTAEQSVYNKMLLEAMNGKIEVTAKQGEVKNTGMIDATGGKLDVKAREDVMNEVLMKAVNGEINITSTDGAITNAGTLDADKGTIELQAAGDIETRGILRAEILKEHGYTFRTSGLMEVGHSYLDNLDGAAQFSGNVVGGTHTDDSTDGGDILFVGPTTITGPATFNAIRNISITGGYNVTLGGDTTFNADFDANGSGALTMAESSSITGSGFDFTLKTSEASTVGAITGVSLLTLDRNASYTPTYTGSAFDDISVNTIKTTYGTTFSKDVTVGSDHLIYSVSDAPGGLQYMDQNLVYSYRMANNIEASETANWNGGLGFDPVGTSTGEISYNNGIPVPTVPFTGMLDGRSYTIMGLTINRPLGSYIGLFGATSGATLHNIGLVGGSVTGKDVVGSLVGDSYQSSISKSYATTNVSGVEWVGGLAGANDGGLITNSYATGSVTGTGEYGTGGLVGYGVSATVTNSYATGMVTGGETNQSGFIGRFDGGIIANNWWLKNDDHNVSLEDTGNLGDLPVDQIATEATLSNFYSSNHPVYLSNRIEGWDFDVEWLASDDALPTFGINPETYLWTGAGGDSNWSTKENWSMGGVSCALDAPGATSIVGFNQTHIENSNIDAGFGGTLAKLRIKGGYTGTITQNMSLEVTGSYIQEGGEFISDPSAQEFVAASFSVPGGAFNRFTGLGTQVSPYMISDIYGLQGMKGFLSLGTYFKLSHDMDISEAQLWNYKGPGDIGDPANYFGFDPVGNDAGGFSGDFNGDFHVISNLVINRPNSIDVGFFGKTSGATIHDVGLAGGSVLGGSGVGSLVGLNDAGSSIANSYATTNVSGKEWVGGLVGYNYDSRITQSYAAGDVTQTGVDQETRAIGGLVGFNQHSAEITYSYATGRVSGLVDVGGLVGANEDLSNISYCYSTGIAEIVEPSNSTRVGGLVGWFYSGVATQNYWDTETSLQTASSGEAPGAMEGKTTAEMKQMTTFSGWDPGIWGLKAGVTYPQLSLYHTQWTGLAGDGKWSTPGNWKTWNGVTHQYDTVVPGVNDLVFFNDIGAAEPSTIDSGFLEGTVAYLGIGKGYGNILTQGHTLITGDFAQEGGTFIGGDSMDLNGFVLNGGNFTAPTTLNVDASWMKSGGTFDSNASAGGTVNFKGTGDQSLTSGGSSFNILTIDLTSPEEGPTSTLQLQDALTVSGELTVTSGTLDVNRKNLSEGGDWYFTNLTNLGNITLTGDGKTIHSEGNKFPARAIPTTPVTLTISGNYSLADALYMRDTLNVTGTLDAANKGMTFEKNVNITNVSNVGAVTATGAASEIRSGGKPFGSLTISSSGDYTLKDALAVTGDLLLDGTGKLEAAGYSITEGGNWVFTGLSGLGPVTLTGTNKTISGNPQNDHFGDLTILGNYSLSASNGIYVGGVLSVPGTNAQGAGTLNASGRSMTLGKSLDLTNISSPGDVTLYGTDTGLTLRSATRPINNLRVSGTYTLADALHVNGWLKLDNGAATPIQTGFLHVNGQNMTLAQGLAIRIADDPNDDWPPAQGEEPDVIPKGDGDLEWVKRIDGIGNVTFDGSGSYTILSYDEVFNTLTISSGTYTLEDALQVTGSLSVTGTGALNADFNMMTLGGSLDLSKTSNPYDVILTGIPDVIGSITSSTKTLNNLTISGDYFLGDSLVTQSLIVTETGTLDAKGKDITTAGGLDLTRITNVSNITLTDFIGFGFFTPAGYELQNLTISGGSYSLVGALHVNGELDVSGSLNIDHNLMTLTGASDLDLTNISNVGNVTLEGSGSITSRTDGEGVDGLTITDTGAYTLTNALTVLGDLVIEEGGTLDALGNAISEGGDWSFTGLSGLGDVMLTLTGSEDKTITSGINELNDSGINEFNNLTISTLPGRTYTLMDALYVNGTLDVTGGNLNASYQAITVYGSLDLTNISNLSDVALRGSGEFGPGNRVLNSLTILGTYTLSGSVVVINDLDVQGTGELYASGNAISEGGDWSFYRLYNPGDVTLTGGSDADKKWITTGDPEESRFSSLTVSGYYSLADEVYVRGLLNVAEEGALDANSQPITVAGDGDLDFTRISNLSDVTINGSGEFIPSGGTLNNLTFSGTNTLMGPVRVDGLLNVIEEGNLDANFQAITTKQNLDLTKIFNLGDVTLEGSGVLTSANNQLDDLTISGNYLLADAIHVNGVLSTTGTGSLDANFKAMTLAQSLDLTKITNYGNITLDGSGSITSYDMEMNTLTIKGNYWLADALRVTESLNLTGAGALDVRGEDMTLAGSLDLTKITGVGDVTLTSEGLITSYHKEMNDLTIMGTYTLADDLHVNGELIVSGSLNTPPGCAITLAHSLDLTKIPDAQSVTLDGSGTITSGGRSVNSLTITGSYLLADDLIVTGDLVLQGGGTLDAAFNDITEKGDWTSLGFSRLGLVTLTGSGKKITSGDEISFGSLKVTGSYSLEDTLIVTGDLNIQGTLDAASNDISEGGDWSFMGLSRPGDVTLTGGSVDERKWITTVDPQVNQFGNLTVSGFYSLFDELRVNGNLNVAGSLDANHQAMSLAHDINITGLTNAGDMTLTGSGIITSGSNQFSNLTISSTGNYSLFDDLTVTGELDVQGTLDPASNAISEGGNWVFTGLSLQNLGDVVLTGNDKDITSGGLAFNDLTISSSGAYELKDALHVNGALRVLGVLDAAGQEIFLARDVNITGLEGVGDLTLTGFGTITSGGTSFSGLTISGTGNYSLFDGLTVTGDLNILGTLDASFQAISVGGDWTFEGVDLSNLGPVTLTGFNKMITSGGEAFNDLAISGSYSLEDGLRVNGALNVAGALNAAGEAMTLAGDLDLTNITNAGDVTLTGEALTEGGTITSDNEAVDDLVISGSYTLVDALQVNGILNVTDTGTLDAASEKMTLGGSLDLTRISNAGDVTLTGSGSITTAGQSVNDLTVSGDYSQSSDLTVNGDFMVQEGGTFTDASPLDHAFLVAGNFSVPYGTDAFRRYTGSGTVSDPYLIRTAYDLQGMKGNLGSHFRLLNDVNMSDFSSWNNDSGFDPVGDVTHAFTGSLDGNGKVISNLAVNRTESDYLGLFGNIGSAGSVFDLALEKVSIYGRDYVGGLAGLNAGNLSRVYTTGVYTVSGADFVGGLVGSNTGSISDAYSGARVIGTENVGGLVGANSGTLNRTYAMGWVTGTTNAGGLVGLGTGAVTNSYWDIAATGQIARGGNEEGTGVLASGINNSMMNQSTYSNWDFQDIWDMDEGGTYPHFQFRYPDGVRGVRGHVYSSVLNVADPGTLVSVYFSPEEAVSESETLLDSTVTDASSGYYFALGKTAVVDTDYVIGQSLDGNSRMLAESGSVYGLDILANENFTLVRPSFYTGEASIEIVPVGFIPEEVSRALVDAGNFRIPAPFWQFAAPVPIDDQTGSEESSKLMQDFDDYGWWFNDLSASSDELTEEMIRKYIRRPHHEIHTASDGNSDRVNSPQTPGTEPGKAPDIVVSANADLFKNGIGNISRGADIVKEV